MGTKSDSDEDPFHSMSIEDLIVERRPNTAAHHCKPDRKWGLPTFSDQVDLGITYYDLVVEPHTVRVNLEFRKHSTGSDIWDSSLVLAHYLASVADTKLRGRNVVELGSGVGAVGLMTKRLGAANVALTDLEANCDLLRWNVKENGLECGVQVIPLPWGQTLPSCLRKVDIVIGSDLFLPFAPELLKPLCDTISDLLSLGDEAEAIIAYEERFDVSSFWDIAAENGLCIEAIPNEELHEKYRDPGQIYLLRITKQKNS